MLVLLKCKFCTLKLHTCTLKINYLKIKKNLDYAFYLDKIAEKLDINWVDANGNAVDKFSY